MNTMELLKFLSRQLQTQIHVIKEDGTITRSVCELSDFTDPYYSGLDFIYLYEQAKKQKLPLLFTFNFMNYALVPNDDSYYLAGPVRLVPPAVFHVFLQTNEPVDFDYFANLHATDLNRFADHIALLWNIERRESCSVNDILAANLSLKEETISLQKRYTDLLFENNEYTRHHNPYNQELREQQSIEHGDIDALKRAFSESYAGEIGTLSKNELRNLRNICIVLTTLASRSAIRGGLSPETAYSLSDSYIQQIEEISNMDTLAHFVRNMEIHYASLVKEAKEKERLTEKKNIPVEQCKNYIFSHLHNRITVELLASELGYNKDYLSHLFKTEEGIGIADYILREKISRSKNLLIYTQFSYSEIAAYLGFSSQSHFGQIFKKFTGETPHRFRQREKSDAFLP